MLEDTVHNLFFEVGQCVRAERQLGQRHKAAEDTVIDALHRAANAQKTQTSERKASADFGRKQRTEAGDCASDANAEQNRKEHMRICGVKYAYVQNQLQVCAASGKQQPSGKCRIIPQDRKCEFPRL